MKPLILFFLISIILLFLFHQDAKAELNQYDRDVIRAIVGECSGEGDTIGAKYAAMKYVAHAIRNRGSLRGMYGLTAKHVDTESQDIWLLAELAWISSANETDPTNGADSWGNKKDTEIPGWLDDKKFKVRYLNHFFFKTQ